MTAKRLAAAFLGLSIVLPAAAADLPERIQKAGKIIIATMPNYAPITYKDPASNKLMGVDIEIGEAIGKELGIKVEWQEIAFAQMLSSLATGRVDTVMAGMSDTPARRETVDFVDYMKTGPQFYVSASRASEFKSALDLCGKKVGASRSTSWPAQIEEWSNRNCVKAGKPAIAVVGTEGSIDARTQLRTGRLDGGVQGNETLPWFLKTEPNTYIVLGDAFEENITGMPFTKQDSALRETVRGALDRMRQNGTYEAILARYDLKATAIAEIGVNQGK
jgi:polar amino acid transport system substrate-binding protein